MKIGFEFLENTDRQELSAIYDTLTPSRRARIDRLKRQEDKNLSLLAELVARRLLAEAGEKELPQSAENGRPFLENSGLYISLTHRGSLAACALDTAPIGIDAERVRPVRSALLGRVCTDEELAFITEGETALSEVIEDSALLDRFFQVWTAKEACFKARGSGITDIKSVNALTLERKVMRKGEYLITVVALGG
jgi:4'-phosphopantetheinyl transferase